MTFAVEYKHHVLPGKEKQFQDAWKKIASHFKKTGDGQVFSLSKIIGDSNTYISYSTWKSKQVAKEAWSHDVYKDEWKQIPDDIKKAMVLMRDSTNRKGEYSGLEVIEVV